ncbi:MAG: hypothetical protein EOQ39_18990 [Mesorhizobium sp.]|uniref:hypothetical protein n=1 Tax=Mesorhizobium sp. TaxID=1871066 RepID=UPI000FE6126A|nr:hypothetical protein [Mesorhizobium sp.]RWB08741.1 MAG: hypothetical protein EOQ37_04345 [Mesorhizobium sp.]RWB13606.1 MAG: hypothetical protein EOQ39_18990 [Mesorhizobium sp.]
MINIYDGNNYFRIVLETDTTGLAPRTMLDKFRAVAEPTIWVWDGAKGNAKRREIYPDYKMNRTPLKKDIFAGFETVQEVLSHTPVIQVKVPGYEADDVIAALARNYGRRREQVAVYSSDADFLQLVSEFPDNLFVGAKPKEHVPANLIRLYKTCVGDPSDNIPGIGGFGDVTWRNADKAQLQALVDACVAGTAHPEIELPKRCHTWLGENSSLVADFWNIVGFIPVDLDLISEHMTVGKPDYAAADTYLKQWFL